VNNFYLYQYRGQRRFVFIPWDRDFAFARPDHAVYHGLDRNLLLRRLLRDGELRGFYETELRRIVHDRVSPLLPRLEEAYAQIRAAVLEDPNKRAQTADPNGEFERAVEDVRQVIREREQHVLAQLAGEEPQAQTPGLRR
jgi:spore coat protein CotH